MMRDQGLEQLVGDWLQERAEGSAPDYLAVALARTRRTRQRPAWSSLGRWLPIESAMRPVRLVGVGRVLAVVALLVALAVAAVAGSRPRLPPPFGEAGNGTVVYGGADGDLYAFDVAAGVSTPLVTGLGDDETPDFSHDGSRFVFARGSDVPGRWSLMVADANGANLRALTGPIVPTWNAWAPDDTQLLVVDASTAVPSLTIHRLDGQAPSAVALGGLAPLSAAFLPDGRDLLVLGGESGMYGIYRVTRGAGMAPRVIAPPASGSTSITDLALSPDGRTLAYTRWAGDRSVIHLVDLASGADAAIQLDPGSEGENVVAWSPDGTALLFHRHAAGSTQLAVVAVAGGTTVLLGPVIPEGVGGAAAGFSPDGQHVLARYPGDGSLWLLDVAGGAGRRLLVDTPAAVSWQRVAR